MENNYFNAKLYTSGGCCDVTVVGAVVVGGGDVDDGVSSAGGVAGKLPWYFGSFAKYSSCLLKKKHWEKLLLLTNLLL